MFMHKYINISEYKYIYECVCGCVCVWYIDVHTKTYALQKRLLSRCRNNNIYLKIYLYAIYS